MNRPETSEFFEYYNTYVSLVPGDDVMPILDEQPNELRAIFASVPEEKGAFAYELGKWTIKELLSHLIDGERIFAYRILRISRGEVALFEDVQMMSHMSGGNIGECPDRDRFVARCSHKT